MSLPAAVPSVEGGSPFDFSLRSGEGREGLRSQCAVVDLKGAIDGVEILIDDVHDDEL